MKYLLVVFLLMDGDWVRGDTLEGWGSIAYPSLEACERSQNRAEALQEGLRKKNPHAYDKRFSCEKQQKSN